jgi:hypothetical protein
MRAKFQEMRAPAWARMAVTAGVLLASILLAAGPTSDTAFAQWGARWGGGGGYGGGYGGGGYGAGSGQWGPPPGEGGYGQGGGYGSAAGQWGGGPPPQYVPPGNPIIYPNRGQSPKQEETDKMQCYNWAKKTSGFDPMAPVQPTAPPPGPQAAEGGAFKGAAAGALGGLAIGSLSGQSGKGAEIGAIAGGLFGGMRRREQMQRMAVEQEQYMQRQTAILQQKRSEYNRAFGACMSGRGYTIN